ncbi:MAG: choice-of-anchor Q domain-containing protein [Saprospiraceae bacterium]
MKNTIFYPTLFLLFFSAALPAQSNRYYVDASATGAGNGASWTDAFADLQAALLTAQWGDTLWVAAGTYYPGTGTDRTQSFEPASGVKIFGGFAGTESALEQRDWTANPVVLSGDIGTPGDSLDNCYNVVYLFQPDSNTVLDGLVIRDGVANYGGAAPSRDRRLCGGGLYIEGTDWEAYPDIRNCRFEHNSAYNFGGGMMVNGSGDGSVAPRIVNCVFSGNFARAGGGGMAKFGGSWVERGDDLTQCTFERNVTRFRGGGYYYADSERSDSITITQCRFVHNISELMGGGAYLLLGREQGSVLHIDYTDFMNNVATHNIAFEIYPQGFAFLKDIRFSNCVISANKDTSINQDPPGVIFNIDQLGIDSSVCTMSKCEIFNNQTLYSETFSATANNCDLMISNCNFTNNNSVILFHLGDYNKSTLEKINISNNITSAFIFISIGSINDILIKNTLFSDNQTTSTSFAPFLLIENIGHVELVNNNFIQNQFTYPDNINTNSPSEFNASNCVIISLPGYDFLNKFENSATISNCYFNTLDCSDFPPNYTCSNLITGIDPLFVNPDSFDFRLKPCSPLVNAGNNTYAPPGTDLAGQPRVLGGTVDIGAYETPLPTLAAQPGVSPACPGTASGSAAFAVAGGCEPYGYAWSNTAGGSGSGADGLVPGDYTFTITDARGSAFTATLAVPAGSPITLSPAPTPLTCGDTLGGSAAMSVAQAHPPLQFLWDDGSTDSLRTPLPPGVYALTVTDAIGCTAAGTVEVGTEGFLDIDIAVQEISCHGAADGALSVQAANGVPPFQWLWASGDTTPTLQPIGPGQYAGALTDAYGCTISWFVPLGQPDSLSYSALLSPASPGTPNGSILLNDIVGGAQPYAIAWSNGDTGPLADSLPAGQHAMTLTDARGCLHTAVFELGLSGTAAPDDAASGFTLQPNPAREAVWLLLDAPTPAALPLRVHDASGRLLLYDTLPAGASRWPIALADWPRGTIWVQLWDGARWRSRVVAVQ